MLERKITDMIEKHQLISFGDKVVAGVSGGPDSLALLHYLKTIRGKYNVTLVVAHVDHMFRGQQSYEDYLFVEKVCKEWDIPFEGKRIDVPKFIKETGKSPQVASRELRYEFFLEVMKKYNIHKLALGHHGDDQMETILMRLTRGAGGSARAGIAVKRNWKDSEIIRPFLCLTKQEIILYCQQYGLVPRIDGSNEKGLYARNRYRQQVLPFLKAENPKVHEHFQRFSEELREDEELLLSLAEEQIAPFWIKKANYSYVKRSGLLGMSKPLQRRAIQLILNYLYFERHEELSASHIEAILTLLHTSHPSGEVHLPNGLRVIKSYDDCTFQFTQEASQPYSLPIAIPGETVLPNGRRIVASHGEKREEWKETGNDVLYIDTELTKFPLRVRSRLNGDRMRVKGLSGSKKVKDIFINEKIPIAERAVWPIVEDGESRIIWIPGIKKSDHSNPSGETSFIILKYV